MSTAAKLTDFNDLHQTKGKAAVAAIIANAALPGNPAGNADAAEWPDLAIPGRKAPPAISPDLLPTWLGEMAAAVAHATATPPDMAVMFALGVVAICVQRRYVVAPKGDDYTEPLSLWVLVSMLSGSRKSAVVAHLKAPLDEWEQRERLALLTHVAQRNRERQAVDELVARMMRDLAKVDDPAERRKRLAEIAEIERQKPDELFFPELYGSEPTPEAVQRELVKQGERFAVLSDEGGVLAILGGIYSGGKGRANNDVFLQGHAGSGLRVHRAGREPLFIEQAAISLVLAIQPGILCEVAENQAFRHTGLIARFLPALPASNIGRRDVRRSSAIAPAIKRRYHEGILGLLAGRKAYADDPVRLDFTEPAREAWFDFAEEIERQQGDGQRFESIRDWTGKLPGAVARIAALIELAEMGGNADGVSLCSAERAVELGRCLIEHALAMFGMIGSNEKDADALAVLRWIKASDLHEFDRTGLYRAHEARFGGNTERATVAIKRLSEWGVLRHYRVRPAKESKGGRPRDLLLVNPKVFTA
jgi:putative DNA primase/helicase